MLEWTTAAPTQEGWYWVRKRDSKSWNSRITQVTRDKRGNLCVSDLCVQNLVLDNLAYGYQWAGPIQEPKEAGE